MISIFDNIKQPKTDQFLTVPDFLIKVKFGEWEDRVIEVREMLSKTSISKERGAIKGSLPNVTISGKFTHRNAKKVISHSGYIALDLDKIENIDNVKDMVAEDQYTYGIFKSISGQGLCVIVKIPTENHLESFKALQSYYLDKFSIEIDKACKDVSRSRYISWDKETVINNGAQLFEMLLDKNEIPETKTTYDNTKIDVSIKYIEDNNIDITDNYEDWINVGMSLANTFGEKGRDNFHRISVINEKYDQKDTDAKYDDFLKNSRGEITIGSFFHYCHVNNIPTPVKEVDHKFWYVKKDLRGKITFEVDNLKFNEFLNDLGYRKYYHTDLSYRFVRIKTKLVEPVSMATIKDHVKRYIKSMHGCIQTYSHKTGDKWKFYPNDLMKYMIDNVSSVFSLDRLGFLQNIYTHDFPTDTKDTMFFFYKNGVIKVKKEGWTFHDYEEVDKLIWKDRVLDYEFRKTKMPEKANQEAIFARFLSCITGNQDSKVHVERYNSLRSIIGYTLHHYNSNDLKAAILTDENSDETNQKGRTGKSLIITAMEHMRDTANINGKNFDYNKSFKYQKVKISTQIVGLNDLNKRMDMERFFNDITEGVEVEYKNKDQFDVFAKLIFTMNRTPVGHSDSFEDRYIIFELTNYFSAKYKPIQEFGKMLFLDFNNEDWFQFYDFMFRCCQTYLDLKHKDPKSGGISKVVTKNALDKRLIVNTSREFCDFMNDTLILKNIKMDADGAFEGATITFGKPISSRKFFELFKNTYTDFNNTKFKQRMFTNWVKFYCDHNEYPFEAGKIGGTSTYNISNKTL